MRLTTWVRFGLAAASVLSVSPTVLSAQIDFRNLDAGRPGVIEDAYAVERFALELLLPTFGAARPKGGPTAYRFEPELEYGLLRNTQVNVGVALAGIGDQWGLAGVDLATLHNFNTETTWPALSLGVEATLPVGGSADDRADWALKAVTTRTIGASRAHVNAALGEAGRWWAGLALDRTLPLHATLLAAELYAAGPPGGGPVEVNAAAGVRKQLTPTLVFDAGVARGLRRGLGPEWAVNIGLSKAVGLVLGKRDAGSAARSASAHPPIRPSAFEPRDERFYTPGAFNWRFLRAFPTAGRLFNAFDYGHAILYERLYTRPGAPVAELEREHYDFITRRLLPHPPRLPLAEEAIAPAYARLAWKAKLVFDWAHALHRQMYDVYADDRITDKNAVVDRLLREYLANRDVALVPVPKSMHLMDDQYFSQVFRRGYPKFNGLIWAYHWLQVGLYEPLLAGRTPAERRALVDTALTRFRGMLDSPPSRMPRVMPMTPTVAPRFTARHPAAAAIFDNLHMLHDIISDILASDRVRDKRAAIYEALAEFQDSTRNVMSPEEWREMSHMMGGIEAMGGPVLPGQVPPEPMR